MIGWVPLYVVRCGEGSLNEKSFYLSFYAEKYEEFKTCKMTLSEFYATLGQQYWNLQFFGVYMVFCVFYLFFISEFISISVFIKEELPE